MDAGAVHLWRRYDGLTVGFLIWWCPLFSSRKMPFNVPQNNRLGSTSAAWFHHTGGPEQEHRAQGVVIPPQPRPARLPDAPQPAGPRMGDVWEMQMSGGVLVPRAPATRTRRPWTARGPTPAAAERVRRWATAPADPQILALWRAFTMWRRQFFADRPVDVAVVAFVAHARVTGNVSAGSAVTYMHHLVGAARQEGLLRESPLIQKAWSGLALEAASAGTRHARDISDDECRSLLRVIRCQEARYALWCMFCFGLRLADFGRFEGWCARRSENRIRLEVRIAKNVRERAERFSFELEVREPAATFEAALVDGRTPQKDCESLNGILAAAACQLGWKVVKGKNAPSAVRAPTTYSFRRNFMHSVIETFSSDRRGSLTVKVVDWLSVCQISGHQQVKTLKASYDK
jgi:hypothetical protein